MTREQKTLLIGLGIGLVIPLLVWAIVHAEPGYHRITEIITDPEEEYLDVIGEIEIDVLDEQGNPTGKKIKRPKTKKKTRKWKEKKITQGGNGVKFHDFGSGETTFFLGRDVKEMLANGHKDFVINFMSVTYLSPELDEEGRNIVKRVSMREWLALGEPSYLEFNPKYDYGGLNRNLTTEGFNQLTEP